MPRRRERDVFENESEHSRSDHSNRSSSAESSGKSHNTSTRNKRVEDQIQNITSFPNDNSKHIDYVIVYKFDPNNPDSEALEKDEMRKAFFRNLKYEGIQIYFIKFNADQEVHVYALLHAPLDTLLKEAERFNLQMRLNNVCINMNYF
jgi:hypothetical protein